MRALRRLDTVLVAHVTALVVACHDGQRREGPLRANHRRCGNSLRWLFETFTCYELASLPTCTKVRLLEVDDNDSPVRILGLNAGVNLSGILVTMFAAGLGVSLRVIAGGVINGW